MEDRQHALQETPGPSRSTGARAIDGAFCLLVAVLFIWPAVIVLDAPSAPFTLVQERRNAAPLPAVDEISATALDANARQFEAWFGDRLGLRAWFLRKHAELYLHLFDESPHHAVLFGKDGWLFQNAPEMVAVARHLDPFDDEGLATWRTRVERRRRVAEAAGGHYVLSFAPCKATIFPEQLPDSHRPQPGPTRIDEFFAHLDQHSDLHWIDVRPALLAVKGRDRIYSATGLHWTDSGAYWGGYRPFLETLAGLGPPFDVLAPHPREAFRESSPVDPHESLGLRLYLADHFPAVVHRLRLPDAPRATRQTIGGPGLLRVTRTSSAAPLRALVLRDSFGTALLPLLSMHFAETYHFLPLRVPEPQILAIIRDTAADVVIDFMYETVLYTPEEILFTNMAAEERRTAAEGAADRSR